MTDPKAALRRILPEQLHLSGTVEQVWEAAQRSFPGALFEEWLQACRSFSEAGFGPACTLAYLRSAPACAEIVGPEAAIELARAGAALGRQAGNRAGLALMAAAPKAARRLADPESFCAWLKVIERLGSLAPESVAALLDRIEGVLAELDVPAFKAWVLGGVQVAGGDPHRRLEFFTLGDPRARRWLLKEADDLVFSDVERRLKAYIQMLWRLQVPIRPPVLKRGEAVPRRASFDNGIIRMPESFRGYAGRQASELFRASMAHIAAHFTFTPEKFPIGELKPLQIALVSLFEDARVEHLTMREYPGLLRLWLPFHVAEARGARIPPVLMARLSRALLDPAHEDDDPWVSKARRMFFDQRRNWEDPTVSRTLGNLLGNDLGQMRIQFNALTYVVEPPYRDDNLGLWDFGDAPQPEQEEADTIYESVRIERIEDESVPPDREQPKKRDEEAGAARPSGHEDEAPEEPGVPVARYPEWDYDIGRERPDWTTIVECPAEPGYPELIDKVLERNPELVHRITSLVRSAKVSRPVRLRRQPEGDHLDLDACIRAAVSRRLGEVPDPRVYATSVRRHRDLSVLVLLDVSQSTNDIVLGGVSSVISLEREAAALLAHAMSGLGDPFAIHAFCSNGREEVRYLRVKDFNEPYDTAAKSRLAGLKGSLSTRIGAALRHAGAELARQLTYRRLLLVVTDGEPSDIDIPDRRYLVEDARKAVANLAHAGIDVFCVGLDAGGDSYLSRIFGQRNFLVIDRLQRLPEKLPMLYFRLTA
ncbi:MAG: VWA domain-containing protein [Proteobacteria bacterium]|nr:VWA domain-containing protein [Pseudomonadota bacterium]